MSRDSRLFATVLSLEEQSRQLHSRLDELIGFRMAGRAQNLTALLRSTLATLDTDIAYMKEQLNTPEGEAP